MKIYSVTSPKELRRLCNEQGWFTDGTSRQYEKLLYANEHGCPISYRAVADLEIIKPFEPNVVKAAWNIFGKSYLYREKYNAYKKERMENQRNSEGKLTKKET